MPQISQEVASIVSPAGTIAPVTRSTVYSDQIHIGLDGAREGSYYTAVASPSGIGFTTQLWPDSTTTFTNTAASFVLVNNGSRTIYPDYIRFLVTLNPATGAVRTSLQYGVVLDSVDRTPNTSALVVQANISRTLSEAGDYVNTPSIKIYTAHNANGVVVAAPGGTSKNIGRGVLRSNANSTISVGDVFKFSFRNSSFHGGSIGGTTVQCTEAPVGPVAIAPGGTLLIYIWAPGQTAGAGPSGEIDLGWLER